MYIVIVGGGKIGENLAKKLSQEKHDVVVIEKDRARADKLAEELNAKVIWGNGQERKILQEAEIKKADVLLAVTGKEETNLMICLAAKEIKPTLRMIVRSGSKEFYKIFYRVGIREVISPETLTADQVTAIITQPDILDLVIFHQEVDLIEFKLKKKNPFIKKSVNFVQKMTPKESMLIAIRRKEKFTIPQPNFKLAEGDALIFISRKKNFKKLKRMFG